MGDDLTLAAGGFHIHIPGTGKPIFMPQDIELSEINNIDAATPLKSFKPPKNIWCEMRFQPIRHRPRWRMVNRAYKIMGTTAIKEFLKGVIKEVRIKNGYMLVRLPDEMMGCGKSDRLRLCFTAKEIEEGTANETLLHLASVHGE